MEEKYNDIKIPLPDGEQAEPENKSETVEDIARTMGWNPDFEGVEGKEKLSAADFIKKGREIQADMRKGLKEQKKMMDDMKVSLQNIQAHSEKVNKAEIAKLKSQLKKEKEEAILDSDVEKVNEIDQKMSDLKAEEKEQKKEVTEEKKAYDNFTAENKWYGSDLDMTDYANYISGVIIRKNKDLSPTEVLEKTTEAVRKEYPEFFGEVSKKKPKTVVNEGGSRPGTSSVSKFTKSDLSEDQRQVMKSFVATGIMTEQQYIDDLAKIGEIG